MISRRLLLAMAGGALLVPEAAFAGREVVLYFEMLGVFGAYGMVLDEIQAGFAEHTDVNKSPLPVLADVRVVTETFPEAYWVFVNPSEERYEEVHRAAGDLKVIRIQFHNWLELARAETRGGRVAIGMGRAIGVNVQMEANLTLIAEILVRMSKHWLHPQCRILLSEVRT